ncbi:hypothetical protein [Ilumatobacter sp.]|uniref:hypothetical protein n=1 Tax=Ilumatobacter sp. TaxID=1967498 RepID=UPI003B52843D
MRGGRRGLLSISLASALAACAAGSDDDAGGGAPASSSDAVDRCVVVLHGKGGDGGETTTEGGSATIRPTGNAEGWGGRQWLYFPEERFAEATDVVSGALDDAGCDTAIVHGFSNGASFAAKLACSGDDLGGRVVGWVVDDPVVDASSSDCAVADGTVVLYWTGALDAESAAGTACADRDWTCEGGETIGLGPYADALGVPPSPSERDQHAPFDDAPPIVGFERTGTFEA